VSAVRAVPHLHIALCASLWQQPRKVGDKEVGALQQAQEQVQKGARIGGQAEERLR
jgi:hypothetical protein